MESHNKLYNPEVKERYLARFDNEGTQTTIKYIFYKTELIEDIRGKDLYDFNLKDIEKAIKNADPRNLNVAKATARWIASYISWAIEAGYRESNIHPMDGVSNEWYEELVDKTKKLHYSKDELIEIAEKLENSQDKAQLFLMFEGIIGEQFSEIIGLRAKDIDKENNMIYISERDESVKVSQECINYVLAANSETKYMTYVEKENRYNEKELLPSEYIFKNVKSPRAKEGQSVNFPVFYTRLNNIKNQNNLEILTANSLRQSGMIYMAAQLFEPYKGITNELLDVIGDKYNYSKTNNAGYEHYNYSLMREFINEDKIEELYNI